MKYTPTEKLAAFKRVLRAIEQGASVRAATSSAGTINASTFHEWVAANEDFAKQYARAMELRTDAKFESIEADYSEEPQRDPETGRIDSAWVQLQRLKIDSKKWELSKLMPKKYGDKLDVTSDGKALELPPIIGMVIRNDTAEEAQDDEYGDLN